MNDIAAILLAAGRSRRMGVFKPLLPFGNQTVIEACIANLKAAGVDNVVVVGGHRAEDLRVQLQTFDVTFAMNSDPESEMGVSIARGVEAVQPEARAVLIALVDQPGVPPKVIKAVIDAWRNGARMVQPEHAGHGGHPVLIDLAYRDELLALDPAAGLRAFFAAHREEVRRLAVASPYVARDMDTWEDYRQLHQDILGVAPPND
ncbi:MAG: molybdenum cofactor cytidylyltransferase [Blastocatellia bacterium]|nr:molybdenum cofactor cytidylyltransferase [Blastocatellia bacterium]